MIVTKIVIFIDFLSKRKKDFFLYNLLFFFTLNSNHKRIFDAYFRLSKAPEGARIIFLLIVKGMILGDKENV